MGTFFDDASLAFLPIGAAGKDGKAYSIKPTNGSGDFTFARGSNLAATRIGPKPNYYIEKGRENLLTESNNFSDSDWSKTNATMTSGQSGYDGTSDAWKFEAASAGTTQLAQNEAVSADTPTTLSVYAKSGNADFLKFIIACSGSNSIVTFDLSDGSTSNNARNISVNAEDVGDGWFRCSATAAPSTDITQLRFEVRSAVDSSSADAGSYIFIQDAQFELGLVATAPIESGASTGKAGLLEDEPRFNYSVSATCPSLLFEPQRTNVVTDSEYFGAWNVSRASITHNATTSPEGLANAAALTEDTTNNSHPLNNTFSVSSGAEHTLTIFAKQGSRRYLALLANNGGSTIYYDLQEKTAGSGGSVEDYGNDWLRLIYTYTTNSTSAEIDILPSINGSSTVYTGDGSNAVFLYGAQIEAGGYPTSYIPTYGGSSVTRSADDMTTTFSSALATNGSATIFFHELGVYDSDDITTSGGRYRYQKDSNNYVSLTTTAAAWRVRIQSGSTSNFKTLSDHPKTDAVKIAVVVSSTNFSIFANGVKETDNQALAATADFSSIDGFLTSIQDGVGARRAVQQVVFPTALTDSECIALTTL